MNAYSLAVPLLLLGAPFAGAQWSNGRASFESTVPVDSAAPRPIMLDFGPGIGSMPAQLFDATSSPGRESRKRTMATQVRVVVTPDSGSILLVRRLATGEHISLVEATLPGAAGRGGMLVRLSDVQVVSAHLMTNGGSLELERDVLNARETLAQLTAERDEAERQLAAIGTLEERKLSAPLDVARARASAEVLAVRVDAQRTRLMLVERRRADWSPLQQELVLSARATEVVLR